MVRSYPAVPSSTFSIRPLAELDSVGIDVAVDDVLFNLEGYSTHERQHSLERR
jgi:hypothetical protein